MNMLYEYLKELPLARRRKNLIFICVCVAVSVLAGAAIWLLLGRLLLPEVLWLLCFMGYSGVFAGFVGSVFYLYNHQF